MCYDQYLQNLDAALFAFIKTSLNRESSRKFPKIILYEIVFPIMLLLSEGFWVVSFCFRSGSRGPCEWWW